MQEAADALVKDAERRAERIIGLVRIGIALVLGGVLITTVWRTIPVNDGVLHRQLVIASSTLALYAALGVVSFILSSKRFHRRWHLYVFATLDVAYVITSLSGALHNTGLPADYVITLPSMWLVPIVIAFGAMRFSAKLQIYAATLMIVSLVGLYVIGGVVLPVDAPLPDELAAFFSAPPNMMRMWMIAVASGIIVLAVYRARRLLKNALAEERRATSLTRFLPAEVAQIIARNTEHDLTRGRRLQVVVLFVDIRGFTARSETMPPEEVVAFLARFRSTLHDAAEAHGGVIDKFIGDGAMIVFGIPRPKADDCKRAVACGWQIFDEVAAWSDALTRQNAPPVKVAIGVHSDEAFIGAIGDERRMEFTVLGDMVNVAARIGETAKTTETGFLVSRHTAERAGIAEDMIVASEELPLRGHAAPSALYTIRASRP